MCEKKWKTLPDFRTFAICCFMAVFDCAGEVGVLLAITEVLLWLFEETEVLFEFTEEGPPGALGLGFEGVEGGFLLVGKGSSGFSSMKDTGKMPFASRPTTTPLNQPDDSFNTSTFSPALRLIWNCPFALKSYSTETNDNKVLRLNCDTFQLFTNAHTVLVFPLTHYNATVQRNNTLARFTAIITAHDQVSQIDSCITYQTQLG
jgi:hypothetical protein